MGLFDFAGGLPGLSGSIGDIAGDISGGASDLFGNINLGGTDPSVSTRQQSLLTGPQRELQDLIANFAQSNIGGPSRTPGSELGPLGPSQLQQQAFGLAGQLPQQLGFDPQQITTQFQPTANFARQGFQQETIPAILAALGAQGANRSSGAANIIARQGRNLELGLAAQLGQQQFGAQQASLGRQAQLPSQIANLGSLQRGIGQEAQQFRLGQFQQADPFANPALNLGLSALNRPAFENLNITRPGTPGILEQLLPLGGQVAGAAGAAGGFGALFAGLSDKRTKENFKPIDNALEKLKQLDGKTYNYKANTPDNKDGGVIAQDVEKIMPEAIIERDGVKYVKYDAVMALVIEAIKELDRKVA